MNVLQLCKDLLKGLLSFYKKENKGWKEIATMCSEFEKDFMVIDLTGLLKCHLEMGISHSIY